MTETAKPGKKNIPPEQALLPVREAQGRSLFLTLTIIALLAGLALIFARVTDRMSDNWSADLQGSVTVQLVLDDQSTREADIELASQIIKSQLPGARISPLSAKEARSLLQPWLGNLELPTDIPIPVLISVKDRDISAPQSAALQEALVEAGLFAEVDDHSRWSDQIGRSGRRIQYFALGILALILTASIAISAFATQAALVAQHHIIRVLVQTGASDGFIARLFVAQAWWRSLKAGILGAFLAAIAIALLALGDTENYPLLWPDFEVRLFDNLWLIALALGFAVFSAFAAFLTAMQLLRRERRRG